MNEEIKILFEDDQLCVIDKPAGWVVNDAESVKTLTVQEWFKEKIVDLDKFKDQEFGQKGGIVHRLDKDTSGVMVLAKTFQAYEGLKDQFLTRKTQKVYIALVHGTWNEQMGLISLPIERFSKNKSKFAVGTDLSKTAVTEWIQKDVYTNNKSDKFSLMELHPHTGRTHQLRVHMQHFGHPIVSDPIYGWKKQLKNDLAWCPRLFLHATSLEFVHPSNQEKQQFSSPLPADLAQAVKSLVH